MNKRLIFGLLFCLLAVLQLSCRHDDQKIRRRDLIPTDKLIPLLSDLYIADGLLGYPTVRSQYIEKDSITNYLDVIKKHGYSKKQLDQTLRYYFINDPKKLQKIYDDVLANLSAIQSSLEANRQSQVSSGLWDQQTSFSIPEEGANNSIYFNIPISDTGYYELNLSAILYKDDQTLNPRITVFFWYADSTGKEVRKIWEKTELARDELKHNYSIAARCTDTIFKHVAGFLFDCDPKKGAWKKHGKITGISLIKESPR